MAGLRHRRGAALVVAMAATCVCAIALAAVVGYVSHTTRMTGLYLGKTACRLAAQSEIELAKAAINYRFELSLNRAARIIGGDTFGASTSSYDWFAAYSGATATKTIGAKNTLTLADSVTNNGCVVKVRVGRVEHTVGSQWANVTLVAEATRTAPGGAVAKSIVSETVRFAQQRSKVFNNAYFVNNYGWFYGGSSTKVNGDIRSNGDMYLDNKVTINGHIYAARNEELNVPGNIASHGRMDNLATYKVSQYGTSNSARPLQKDPVSGAYNKGGYDAPEGQVSDAVLEARKHANGELSVEMPYIGEICYEGSEYREWIEELRAGDPDMCKVKVGGVTKIDRFYNGVGPSGEEYYCDASGNQCPAPDYGAIVLEGTYDKPIELNGPVVVANDVIIKGYVTGQGTIYSGRNIHIVGNIKYKNPPTWANKSTSGTDNGTADMVGLMAKGNIVLGNCTTPEWLSSVRGYLSSDTYVKHYACDTSDANIGYPATFGGSYEVSESVPSSQLSAEAVEAAPGGCREVGGSYYFGKSRGTVSLPTGNKVTVSVPKIGQDGRYIRDWWGRIQYEDKEVDETVERPKVSYDRKYYETACEDSVVSSRAEVISRVDAVLYNNHGIFGTIGSCTFNGALVCRNEAIIYDKYLNLNWDIRLYSGSSETVDNDKVGLARASDNPPVVVDWRELPEGVVTFD